MPRQCHQRQSLIAALLADVFIQRLEPAFGDGFHAVGSAGQHAGDGAGGVGVAAAIDDVGQAVFEIFGGEE